MIKESILQWGHDDLSLMKGVTASSSKRVKPGTPASRRVLKHMKFDKRSGHFIPSERKKLNRMQITVKVDEQNFRVLHEMLGHRL